MANAWREHVKKTMAEMKAKAKGGKVMLKDVLKVAGKTYKKSGKSESSAGKTRKRKGSKKGKKAKNSKKH
jgi:hypothetical protein